MDSKAFLLMNFVSGMREIDGVLPGVIEAFCGHAFFAKGAFQLAELSVEREVGLVDQANPSDGGGFGVLLFNLGSLGQMGLIGPVDQRSDCPRSRLAGLP